MKVKKCVFPNQEVLHVLEPTVMTPGCFLCVLIIGSDRRHISVWKGLKWPLKWPWFPHKWFVIQIYLKNMSNILSPNDVSMRVFPEQSEIPNKFQRNAGLESPYSSFPLVLFFLQTRPTQRALTRAEVWAWRPITWHCTTDEDVTLSQWDVLWVKIWEGMNAGTQLLALSGMTIDSLLTAL
jgi:hypothetical protein